MSARVRAGPESAGVVVVRVVLVKDEGATAGAVSCVRVAPVVHVVVAVVVAVVEDRDGVEDGAGGAGKTCVRGAASTSAANRAQGVLTMGRG